MAEYITPDDRRYTFAMSNAYEHHVLVSVNRQQIETLTPVWANMLQGYFLHSFVGDTLQYSTNMPEGFHLSITRKL